MVPERPKQRGAKVTLEIAVQWIAYAAKRPIADVLALELEDDQFLRLGQWLSQNKLLNPPQKIPAKIGTFRCQCGCGQTFTAGYKTKTPKYLNATHRQRAYRARKARRS